MANESLVSAKIGPYRACYREADDDKGIATTATAGWALECASGQCLKKRQTTEY